MTKLDFPYDISIEELNDEEIIKLSICHTRSETEFFIEAAKKHPEFSKYVHSGKDQSTICFDDKDSQIENFWTGCFAKRTENNELEKIPFQVAKPIFTRLTQERIKLHNLVFPTDRNDDRIRRIKDTLAIIMDLEEALNQGLLEVGAEVSDDVENARERIFDLIRRQRLKTTGMPEEREIMDAILEGFTANIRIICDEDTILLTMPKSCDSLESIKDNLSTELLIPDDFEIADSDKKKLKIDSTYRTRKIFVQAIGRGGKEGLSSHVLWVRMLTHELANNISCQSDEKDWRIGENGYMWPEDVVGNIPNFGIRLINVIDEMPSRNED